MSVKGTVNSDVAPWKSYSTSFDEKLDDRLAKEVDEYSKKVHSKSSAQNEEELARQREINNNLSEEYRWVHPDEYKDVPARIGQIRHSSELITLLRDHGINCWYVNHPQPRKLTLLISKYNHKPEVACWVQQGFMPELSIMDFDDHGVPLAEKYRGWRTVLLQLILKEFLTETDANDIFGVANVTPQFHRYNALLKNTRNTVI